MGSSAGRARLCRGLWATAVAFVVLVGSGASDAGGAVPWAPVPRQRAAPGPAGLRDAALVAAGWDGPLRLRGGSGKAGTGGRQAGWAERCALAGMRALNIARSGEGKGGSRHPAQQGAPKRPLLQRLFDQPRPGELVARAAKGKKKEEADPQATWKGVATYAGHKVAAGVFSGLLQAGIFHPWDRALYLAQTNGRAFVDRANWRQPFQGLWQTLILRVTSATVFFPLEDAITPLTEKMVGKGAIGHFLAGNFAGAVNAIALNPAQAVRYRCFSILEHSKSDVLPSFFGVAKEMSANGIAPFFKGIYPTVGRDLVFGGVFTSTRRSLASFMSKEGEKMDESMLLACDLVAALAATTLSSPFNYARNLIYAASPGVRSQTVAGILGGLVKTAARQPTAWKSAMYVQSELKIGVANLRVAVAMAMASSMYRLYYRLMEAAPAAKKA